MISERGVVYRTKRMGVVGMGSSSQDLADALLIIFKTNSSVTDSKVSKGFPAKEVSGKQLGLGSKSCPQMSWLTEKSWK